MNMRSLLCLGLVVAALLAPLAGASAQGAPDFVTAIETEDVMAHVRALSVAIGARVTGTEAEARAADYAAAALRDWGYTVEVQEFETQPGDAAQALTSRNVIATRPGDKAGGAAVVVGAHLDSVEVGTGAGDNASGVAALLAAAQAMRDLDLAHPVVFVAFGAEESGAPTGSEAYVYSLGEAAGDILAMINIDSVGVGAALNVYAGAEIAWPDDEDAAPEITGGPVWVRDLALDLAAELRLPFGTSPDDTWGGYTGDWSDHYAFVEAGVPVAYFEAWLWDGAADPWWGQETPEGDILHSAGDIYAAVKPAQVEMAAELVAATATAIASGLAGPG